MLDLKIVNGTIIGGVRPLLLPVMREEMAWPVASPGSGFASNANGS